jgi:hypothetical protein
MTKPFKYTVYGFNLLILTVSSLSPLPGKNSYPGSLVSSAAPLPPSLNLLVPPRRPEEEEDEEGDGRDAEAEVEAAAEADGLFAFTVRYSLSNK